MEQNCISCCAMAHSLWSWKQMDFVLIDPRMDGVRDELLTLL